MMSNDEKTAKLHEASLALLRKVDAVAKEHGISYMLDAGTLLGAVRHKGFIPWDDDVDICMLREDYERFLSLAPGIFTDDFGFILPGQRGDGKFYDFVPKVTYEKITVAQSGLDDTFYNGRYSHPALDIFVIDKVPDSRLGQLLHTKLLVFIYGLAMGHRREIDYSKYSGMQAVVIALLSTVGRLIPLHTVASWYSAAAKMFAKKKKKTVMSTHSAMDHFGDCYEYRWYEERCELSFEGCMLPAPLGYDEILKRHYGDYTALPPEEKRVPKHLNFDIFEIRN